MKPETILKIENEIGFELNIAPIDLCPNIPTNSFCLNQNNDIVALNIKPNYFEKDDLLNTKISDYSFLSNLTYLTTLILTDNEIRNISFLKDLIQLSFLELQYNQIIDISILSNLKKLKYLNLRKNLIEDISTLKNLTQLSTLNLGKNLISDISPLEHLSHLRVLLLGGNKISDVPFKMKFNNLECLDLSHTNITNINFLKDLTVLQTLQLEYNNISNVSFVMNCNKLINLNISDNNITNIDFLKDLHQLETLGIVNNDISDITLLLKFKSLKHVKLAGNQKIDIDFPKEVLEAGWASIKQFSEDSKNKVAFKNVKVLLLGNPNIGKSNLLEYFETNKAPVMHESTHGVRYKQIKLNDINFHFWDFGGQDYFHATHQLFFSTNAINLVLWGKDISRGSIQETCFQIDYWLRIITQLNGKNKEIAILAENKIDLNNPKYSENKVSTTSYEKFNNLIIYESHISLTELKNLNGFKEKFLTVSEEIINKFQYPKFYEVFWNRINSLDKDYATINEINNRPHDKNVVPAAKVFHNMGMLLYFSDIIPNKIFHKPQVLLELLYTKVLSPEKKIKITKNEIEDSLVGNSLGLTCEEVIALLKRFNLVFQLNNEKDVYFIPQYLLPQSKIQEIHEKLGFSGTNIKIKADQYLMSLAMLKIFTRYGEYADLDKDEYLFWHNGIVILKDNQNLLIKYIAQKQIIELYTSKKGDNKSLQKEIVDFILDLPEAISMPKRNLENHRQKRWLDILDENDEDFSPHFSDRIQEYPGYLEDFERRNWDNKYNWASDFFNVEVSIDGEFFIEWKELKKNEGLSEINFINEEFQIKKTKTIEYCYLIDKKVEMDQDKQNNQSVTYNFNGPVNAGIIGGKNRVETQNINDKEESKASSSKGLANEELKAVERWKLKALMGFLCYALFSLWLIYIYISENEFVMSKIDWTKFKESDISKIAITIWSFFGIYLFYKLIFDRYLDPSKENAFIDLNRKRNY